MSKSRVSPLKLWLEASDTPAPAHSVSSSFCLGLFVVWVPLAVCRDRLQSQALPPRPDSRLREKGHASGPSRALAANSVARSVKELVVKAACITVVFCEHQRNTDRCLQTQKRLPHTVSLHPKGSGLLATLCRYYRGGSPRRESSL